MKWCRSSDCQFYWCHWDDDRHILFNTASGQTHYLSQFAVDLFALFSAESLDLSCINERLSGVYDNFIFDDETKAYVQQILEDLQSFGLIDAV